MELSGNFLQRNVIRQTQMMWPQSTERRKRCSLTVVGMFDREAFPAEYCRAKNVEVHCNNDPNIHNPNPSNSEGSHIPGLSFTRKQLTDQECSVLQKRYFGRFVARTAILDEEYWTAAWLRAEAHWESSCYTRHVDSYKIKYAEQEFYALKRRCFGQDRKSSSCLCFVAVKKEEKNVRRTVLNSIVGTLDLSIRQFAHGETYPKPTSHVHAQLEIKKSSTVLENRKYAYIANVVVAKFARRQGIATNMLYLATDVATMAGMKRLFVHVNADNKPAQNLYEKIGFKVVEGAETTEPNDEKILMSMDL